MCRVFNFKLNEEIVHLVIEADGLEHGDHSGVPVQREIPLPLIRVLEPERFIRQIPIIRVFDVHPSNLCVRGGALEVVDEDFAVAGRHGVVVHVANGQEKLTDVAQVLVVANFYRDLVTFLFFPVEIDTGLEHVAAVPGFFDSKPRPDIRISSFVDLKTERRPVLVCVVVVRYQVSDSARTLIFWPDQPVGHVQERCIVIDVFEDDFELDVAFDAGGAAVFILGEDVGGPLGVPQGQVSVQLLDDPDLTVLLVDTEVGRHLGNKM